MIKFVEKLTAFLEKELGATKIVVQGVNILQNKLVPSTGLSLTLELHVDRGKGITLETAIYFDTKINEHFLKSLFEENTPETQDIKFVKISDLKENHYHSYRSISNHSHLNELIEDIKINGVKKPILISSDMVVIDGIYRLEACRRLGLSIIPFKFAGSITE